jgi:hypothetical protein
MAVPQHHETRKSLVKREKLIITGALLGALAAAPGAQAATTASGSQAITGTPTAQLAATFPSAYAFGTLTVGGAGNTSTEQIVNVKSNASWGVKISTDQAAGKMREWDGSAYVAAGNILTNALQWALTSTGGTPVGSPTYADLSSTATLVTTGQARTSDSGVDVGTTFKQLVSYGDQASLAGGHSYRVLVTYDAAQGF